jgi:hypothetical protein
VRAWVGRGRKKQIPSGKDRKKSKGNGKSQYRGLSTALRFGRDDDGFGGDALVERAMVAVGGLGFD